MWRYSLFAFILIVGLKAQTQDWIIFPHQFHVVEEELECSDCHEGVSDSPSLASRLLPDMDTCADCHEDDTDDGDCSLCHTNPDDPLPFEESQPADVVEYSHQFHLLKGKECFDCHAWVLEDDGQEPARIWTTDDCRQCHEKSKPENHVLQWISLHGLEVNSATQRTCDLCHTVSSCDQCHQLQQFEPQVHPVDYILSHSFDARVGTIECSTCHDIISDCYQCHNQNHIMPLNHNQMDWVGFSFDDGGQHSIEALDEPDLCQACHLLTGDSACLRCHGDN